MLRFARFPRLVGVALLAAAAATATILGFATFGATFRWAAATRILTDGRALRVSTVDARPRSVLWESPRPVPAPIASEVDQYEPRYGFDDATLVFVRGRPGEGADLFESRRVAGGWSDPVPIAAVNTEYDELAPELARDGRTMLFASDRPGGLGGYDLWITQREEGGAWSAPRPLGEAVNSPFDEYGPALAPAGGRLYFVSNRPRVALRGDEGPLSDAPWQATVRERRSRPDFDLYEAPLLAGDFGAAVPIAGLNTDADEASPAIAPHGDFLYFASDRAEGQGGFDLYRARLDAEGRPGPVENLGAMVNSVADELDPALAAEGFRLTFSSDREGGRSALWSTASREVYETAGDFGVRFASFLQRIWPWLLAVLALAALLLLLWSLLRDLFVRGRWRTLHLLTKCVLISVFLHALLAALFTIWTVGSELARRLHGEGRPTRVLLASSLHDAHGAMAAQLAVATVAAPSEFEPTEVAPPLAVVPMRDLGPERLAPPPGLLDAPPIAVRTLDRDLERTVAPIDAPVLLRVEDVATPVATPKPAHASESDDPSIRIEARREPPSPSAFELAAVEDVPPSLPTSVAAVPALAIEEVASPSFVSPPPSRSMTIASDLALPPIAATSAASASSEPQVTIVDLAAPSIPMSASSPPVATATLDLPAANGDAPPLAIDPSVPAATGPVATLAATLALGDLSLPTSAPPPEPIETFAQRGAEHRDALLAAEGGDERTERAVAAALAWFARHQRPDGSWSGSDSGQRCAKCVVAGCQSAGDADAPAAMTGLALLAFLGAGHTHVAEGPHRETVDAGLRWLLARQDPVGDLRGGRETMYGQTIGCVALCEAFAMTRDPRLAEAARSAIAVVLDPRRGDRGTAAGTAVVGWQIMAVESARRAGLSVPNDTFTAAGRWLDSIAERPGSGRYAHRAGEAPSAAMTAEAMFVRHLLGSPSTERRMGESAAFLLETPPRWREGAPTHSWYYATLALFQHGGESWRSWNEALVPELVANQRSDGCCAGSWDPQDRWSTLGGRHYQTAICALSLEVYYRYAADRD